MGRLRADFGIAALGAFAGLFTFSVFLLFDRVEVFYKYLACLDTEEYTYCAGNAPDLWWTPFAFWHVLMFVLASFVAHRYFADLRKSPFLLWQLVGLCALCAWVLSFASGLVIEGTMRGGRFPYEWVRGLDLVYIGKFVAAVFASNTLCATFLQSAARQYAQESGQRAVKQ